MGRVTEVKPHLDQDEIKQKIKETKGFWRVQKWLVILNAMTDPRPASEIALHTGLAQQTVHNLISEYNRIGPKAIEGPGKGGRRRSYLTLDQEKEFLEPFINKALTGQMATVKDVKISLEGKLGRTVHKTTVYRMLKRHGWRKLVPRPVHVKTDKQKQEEFKKSFKKK